MRINVRFQEQNSSFVGLSETNDEVGVKFSSVQTQTDSNYLNLNNKPIIENVVLQGALTAEDFGFGRVYYDTSENWNSHLDLVPAPGAVYIYSDYTYIDDEVGNRTWIAGLKIGDGHAYLIDLPFVTDNMTYTIVTHIADTNVHISSIERQFWNNKISAYMSHEEEDTLVLSKISYEDNGEIITI